MPTSPSRRAVLGGLLATPALDLPVLAQPSWPSRPIRVIVPSTTGGFDVYVRMMAPRLAELLGQPVVVDNRPGANGTIGAQEVQRSPADGHTIMFGTVGALTINISVYRNMPLDPVEDLAAIAIPVSSPMVWVVNPATPFHSLAELLARVKAEPGRWPYALPSAGTITHLIVEDFKLRHGLDMPAVPYRGTPQAQVDVIAGQVPIMLDSVGAGYGHISGGRFRALATTGAERSPRLPALPTMLELGLDPREYLAWYAFMAPKATPPEVVLRLNRTINQVAREPAIIARFEELGAAPLTMTPAEVLAFMRAERTRWGAIVRAGNIQAE